MTEVEVLELLLLANIALGLVNCFWLGSIRGRLR